MVGDQRVALWPDLEQAKQAAGARGKPIVLHVEAARLYHDGFELYLAEDGSWHTELVPIEYFQI